MSQNKDRALLLGASRPIVEQGRPCGMAMVWRAAADGSTVPGRGGYQ